MLLGWSKYWRGGQVLFELLEGFVSFGCPLELARLFQQLKEGQTFLLESRDKTIEGYHAPYQFLNIFDTVRLSHRSDCLNLFCASFDTRWLMRKPNSCTEGTPNTHLVGLSFHLYARRLSKVCFRSAIRVEGSLVLTTTSST